MGHKKSIAYVKGKKKKGSAPLHQSWQSKLIHEATSGGNDLRPRCHQALRMLLVEDTASQAEGSPATAGRWPRTQPAFENTRRQHGARLCCSACARRCRRSEASDLKPSSPQRLPSKVLTGQTILKSPCRSLRAERPKPNDAHRCKSPSLSIGRRRVSQGSPGAEAGLLGSELTQSGAPLSENALSPEVQGQLRLSHMERPERKATI